MRHDVCLVRLALVAVAGLAPGCNSSSSSSPSSSSSLTTENQVWDRFFADIRGKRWPDAHAEMVVVYRDHDSVEDLRRAIEANPLAATHTGLEISFYGSCDGMDRGMCAGGGLVTSIGKVSFELRYVHEGNADRIITVTIGGAPLVGVGIPKVPEHKTPAE